MQCEFSASHIEELCQGLLSNEFAHRLRAVTGLRLIVSEQEDFEVMQRLIDQGCVPVLLQYMSQQEHSQLQLEATWVLTNLACGRTSQCQSIIDKDGLGVFFQAISQNSPSISEQALWGLGNIAADNPRFRDLILNKGGLAIVLKTIEESQSASMLRQGAWAVSSLCRGSPKPKYPLIKTAIPVLAKLVMCGLLGDEDVGVCLWAIAGQSEAQKTRIAQVVDIKGFVPHLFERCRKQASLEVLAPLLRVVGNISTGNELQT
jgi:importin subunit alpha-6/7